MTTPLVAKSIAFKFPAEPILVPLDSVIPVLNTGLAVNVCTPTELVVPVSVEFPETERLPLTVEFPATVEFPEILKVAEVTVPKAVNSVQFKRPELELNVKFVPVLGAKLPVSAVANNTLQVVSEDSSATVTDEAIDAVPVTLPVSAPANAVDVNVPVLGTYVNAVFVPGIPCALSPCG